MTARLFVKYRYRWLAMRRENEIETWRRRYRRRKRLKLTSEKRTSAWKRMKTSAAAKIESSIESEEKSWRSGLGNRQRRRSIENGESLVAKASEIWQYRRKPEESWRKRSENRQSSEEIIIKTKKPMTNDKPSKYREIWKADNDQLQLKIWQWKSSVLSVSAKVVLAAENWRKKAWQSATFEEAAASSKGGHWRRKPVAAADSNG